MCSLSNKKTWLAIHQLLLSFGNFHIILSRYTNFHIIHNGIINRKPPRIQEAQKAPSLSSHSASYSRYIGHLENQWKTGGNWHQKQMIPTILKNNILLKHNIKNRWMNNPSLQGISFLEHYMRLWQPHWKACSWLNRARDALAVNGWVGCWPCLYAWMFNQSTDQYAT